jgi:hypothetical protein
MPSYFLLNSKDKTESNEVTFEEWEDKSKFDYPIRFWFQFTLVNWVYQKLIDPIKTMFYWIRTHTYNKYHMIDLRCPTWGLEYNWGWIDRCEALLIANFQILKEFVEKEEPFKHGDWSTSLEHQNAEKEIKELYNWWVKERVKEHEVSLKLIGKKRWSIRKKLEKKDDKMLLRLIKIREYLWT